MAGVVVVTGVGRSLGARVSARLADDRSISRVLAVDTVPPRADAGLGRAEFVRAEISHPLIAKVLDQAGADTVVHTYPAHGAAALLGACGQARTLTRVVAVSSTQAYGCSRRDPAVFAEDMGPAHDVPTRAGREVIELESALRALARRRPELTVTTLRLAALVGPSADSWLSRYLALPVAPTVAGFDPRVQLLHEDDAVEAIVLAARTRFGGVANVAGAGVLSLVQLLRLAGRWRVPVPAALVGDLAPLLQFSPVADTMRLRTELGFTPRYPATEALHAHLAAHPAPGGPGPLAAAVLASMQSWVGARA